MSVWPQDRCGVSPRTDESRRRVVEPAIHETGEEAVENRGVMARYRVSDRFHALIAAQVTLAVVGSAIGSPPAHAASCALPAALRVAVEERGSIAAGVELVASAPSCCGLRAGDVVRQANGTRVSRCADLEPVAAEALARGLALLLAVERDGELIAVAAMTRESEQRVLAGASERAPADRALTAPAAGGGAATGVPEHADAKRAATAPGAERAVSATKGASSTTERAAATPLPESRPTPRPRRAATLPARVDAPPELRQRAAAAASATRRCRIGSRRIPFSPTRFSSRRTRRTRPFRERRPDGGAPSARSSCCGNGRARRRTSSRPGRGREAARNRRFSPRARRVILDA